MLSEILSVEKKTREVKGKAATQIINLKANLSKFVGISNTLLEQYNNEQSFWETPYKRVL